MNDSTLDLIQAALEPVFNGPLKHLSVLECRRALLEYLLEVEETDSVAVQIESFEENCRRHSSLEDAREGVSELLEWSERCKELAEQLLAYVESHEEMIAEDRRLAGYDD